MTVRALVVAAVFLLGWLLARRMYVWTARLVELDDDDDDDDDDR